MKTIQNLLFTVFLLVIMCNCKNGNENDKKDKKIKNANNICIPDSNQFYYKRLKRTPSLDEPELTNKLHGLNDAQVDNWIRPLFHDSIYPFKSDLYIKMVSFQNKTSKYMSIIIAFVFEMPEQYLITINNKGKYIDGIPISFIKDLSNSDIEYDSLKSLYKFSTKVSSNFELDTIRMYSIEDVSKIENPHENKDAWQELYETKYIVKQDGKIQLRSPKKKINSSIIKDLQN